MRLASTRRFVVSRAIRRKGSRATRRPGASTQYGPNRLPEGSKRGPLMRFLLQFDNILVYVLLAAGFVKLMLGLWLDASIITGVVVINALLGFIQEGKAEKALDSIRNMLSSEARTLRDGETRVVAAEELVPGDVVLLESGDRIPADIRLIEVKNLRTDEAALTGESVPADKSTDPTPENSTVGDRENMAFSGTLVVSGRAVWGSSSARAQRRSSAASIRCSPPSTCSKRRCCARSRSSDTRSRK